MKVCRSKRGRQNTSNNARVNNLGNNESEIAYSDTPDSSSDDDYVFGLREAMLVNKSEGWNPQCVTWRSRSRRVGPLMYNLEV